MQKQSARQLSFRTELLHSAFILLPFKVVGCHGIAPCSRRVRAGTSLPKFAAQSRREGGSRNCGTPSRFRIGMKPSPAPGFRVAKSNPKRTERGIRPLVRPCEVSTGKPGSLGKWTSIRVSRPVLRVGSAACISQHLCSEKWPANCSPSGSAGRPTFARKLRWATPGLARLGEGWNPVLELHSRPVGTALQAAA